jgi:hypothetical protein
MFASVESPVGAPACRPGVPRATTFRSTSGPSVVSQAGLYGSREPRNWASAESFRLGPRVEVCDPGLEDRQARSRHRVGLIQMFRLDLADRAGEGVPELIAGERRRADGHRYRLPDRAQRESAQAAHRRSARSWLASQPGGLSVDTNIPPSARLTPALGSGRCPGQHSPPRTTAFASVGSLVGTPAFPARAPGEQLARPGGDPPAAL